MNAIFLDLQKNVERFTKAHGPEILTAIGISGWVFATVESVRATPGASRRIEEKKSKDKLDKLTPLQAIQATWPCYIKPVIISAVSTACLIGANSVHLRRQAALVTAYSLSETALKDYGDKVKSVIGEKKDTQIRDEIAKDQLARNPVNETQIVQIVKGSTLCFDPASGRYFKSDIETIKCAENAINRRMMSEMYISLNEFYAEIGLDSIEVGDDLGWDVDKGFLEITYTANIASNGEPCIVINYSVSPEYFKHYIS